MSYLSYVGESFVQVGNTWKNCGNTPGQTGALAADQAFQKTLNSNYAQVFGENQDMLSNLNTSLEPIISAGPSQQGFSPEELAAQNSQAINNAAASNKNVQQAIGENAAAMGPGGTGSASAVPGVESGVTQAAKASAAASVENNLSNTEANITNANYATGRQNFWNAVTRDEAAPSAFESPATSLANAETSANQVEGDQANANQKSDLGSSLLGLGEGLSQDAATFFKPVPGCWVAAAVFGEDFETGVRTNLVRDWLWNVWAKNWYATPILWVYSKFGKWVSRQVVLVNILRPLFLKALARASR
jgi:hypothetical protein